MTQFVLDCSLTMAWCFEDEATPYSESVLDALGENQAFVPSLWPLEVANVLAVAERKKRLLPAHSLRFVELLQNLPISLELEARPIRDILALAREHQLSAYDACYLDLALRHGLTLASLDKPLLQVTDRLGIARFAPTRPEV
jgi:predicted nucleic acid-binding protein